jgi:hypothetical protein
MQPFSAQNQQQMTFRYFDSKRPLVVSFRRVNKMTQNNFTLEHCNSVNDFHRIDMSGAGCGSSYGLNMIKEKSPKYCLNAVTRNGAIKSSENPAFRNFNYIDKQRAHFEVQYDDADDDDIYDKATITYPKEKFYGNAKLSMTEEALRKKPLAEQNDNGPKLLRNLPSNRHNNTNGKAPGVVNGSQVSLSELNTHKSFLESKFAKILNSRNDVAVSGMRVNRKCSSSPSLCKISHFPSSLDMDCKRENDNGFTSILSAKRKEAFHVKTSKSC